MSEKSFMIKISDVKLIQEFCKVCNLCSFDIDVRSIQRNLVIDAKSILGLYSLDLSQPVMVVIHTDDEKIVRGFGELMKAFEVK